jgi:uncharacterized glyoxalase superfamily protein PhnB
VSSSITPFTTISMTRAPQLLDMRVIQALQRAFDHQHREAVHGGPRQVFRAGPASGIERAGLVMHAAFRIGETTLMGSDGMNSGKPSFQGFALSLSPSEPKEASCLFNALADGGQVHMPLTQTFFFAQLRHGGGSLRGIVDDRRPGRNSEHSVHPTEEDCA